MDRSVVNSNLHEHCPLNSLVIFKWSSPVTHQMKSTRVWGMKRMKDDDSQYFLCHSDTLNYLEKCGNSPPSEPRSSGCSEWSGTQQSHIRRK
jgi:hypothetical protein